MVGLDTSDSNQFVMAIKSAALGKPLDTPADPAQIGNPAYAANLIQLDKAIALLSAQILAKTELFRSETAVNFANVQAIATAIKSDTEAIGLLSIEIRDLLQDIKLLLTPAVMEFATQESAAASFGGAIGFRPLWIDWSYDTPSPGPVALDLMSGAVLVARFRSTGFKAFDAPLDTIDNYIVSGPGGGVANVSFGGFI